MILWNSKYTEKIDNNKNLQKEVLHDFSEHGLPSRINFYLVAIIWRKKQKPIVVDAVHNIILDVSKL